MAHVPNLTLTLYSKLMLTDILRSLMQIAFL